MLFGDCKSVGWSECTEFGCIKALDCRWCVDVGAGVVYVEVVFDNVLSFFESVDVECLCGVGEGAVVAETGVPVPSAGSVGGFECGAAWVFELEVLKIAVGAYDELYAHFVADTQGGVRLQDGQAAGIVNAIEFAL